MEKKLKEFRVYRKRWGNGSTNEDYESMLYNSENGKSCCFGFWENQVCRIPFKNLDQLAIPTEVYDKFGAGKILVNVQSDKNFNEDKTITQNIMIINDTLVGDNFHLVNEHNTCFGVPPVLLKSEAHREELLTELFAEIGYKPVFVD